MDKITYSVFGLQDGLILILEPSEPTSEPTNLFGLAWNGMVRHPAVKVAAQFAESTHSLQNGGATSFGMTMTRTTSSGKGQTKQAVSEQMLVGGIVSQQFVKNTVKPRKQASAIDIFQFHFHPYSVVCQWYFSNLMIF
jgi:hypothetical protein